MNHDEKPVLEYEDADGNKCSLLTLCRREPEWAANVITSLKAKLAKQTVLTERANDFRKELEWGIKIRDYLLGDTNEEPRPGASTKEAEEFWNGVDIGEWRARRAVMKEFDRFMSGEMDKDKEEPGNE